MVPRRNQWHYNGPQSSATATNMPRFFPHQPCIIYTQNHTQMAHTIISIRTIYHGWFIHRHHPWYPPPPSTTIAIWCSLKMDTPFLPRSLMLAAIAPDLHPRRGIQRRLGDRWLNQQREPQGYQVEPPGAENHRFTLWWIWWKVFGIIAAIFYIIGIGYHVQTLLFFYGTKSQYLWWRFQELPVDAASMLGCTDAELRRLRWWDKLT